MPSVVAQARHAITECCRGWHVHHLVDAVELLVSEMVTNAITHAVGPVRVVADFDGDRVRVEVHDNSPDGPRARVTPPSDLDEHGRGLQLIAMLADRWGSTGTSTGKAVWIELAVAGPSPLG